GRGRRPPRIWRQCASPPNATDKESNMTNIYNRVHASAIGVAVRDNPPKRLNADRIAEQVDELASQATAIADSIRGTPRDLYLASFIRTAAGSEPSRAAVKEAVALANTIVAGTGASRRLTAAAGFRALQSQ